MAVTPAGREVYERLQRERSALIEDYLGGLTGEGSAALVAALPLLEGLADHLVDSQAVRASAGAAR